MEYSIKNNNMKLTIDYLSFTFDDPDNLTSSIGQLISLQKSDQFPGMVIKNTPRYKYSARIPFESSQGKHGTLTVELEPNKKTNSGYRVDFNPSRANEKGQENIRYALAFIHEGGFEEMFKKGKITRIDIAIDLAGLTLEGVIPMFPKLRKRAVHADRHGRVESLHIGTRNSSRLVLYDKVIEGTDCLRVERRINPKVTGQLLLQIPDALHKLCLVDASFVKKSWVGGHKRPFLDSVCCRGEKKAISDYPPAIRKKFLSGLNSNDNILFDATSIWSEWPQLLIKSVTPYCLHDSALQLLDANI